MAPPRPVRGYPLPRGVALREAVEAPARCPPPAAAPARCTGRNPRGRGILAGLCRLLSTAVFGHG
jgi:hypothetical protein